MLVLSRAVRRKEKMLPIVESASTGSMTRQRRRLHESTAAAANRKCVVAMQFLLVSAMLVGIYSLLSYTTKFSGDDEGYLVLLADSAIIDRVRTTDTRYSRNFREIARDGHAGMLVVTEHSNELDTHISGTLCSRLHGDKHRRNMDRRRGNDRPTYSEFKPETSYRLFIEDSEPMTAAQGIDVQWIRLRAQSNASIELESMSATNSWIEQQMSRARLGGGVVVCCTGGSDQCNVVAALYLMYTRCWRLANADEFLANSLYSRSLQARYRPALAAYEKHLRDTKC